MTDSFDKLVKGAALSLCVNVRAWVVSVKSTLKLTR